MLLNYSQTCMHIEVEMALYNNNDNELFTNVQREVDGEPNDKDAKLLFSSITSYSRCIQYIIWYNYCLAVILLAFNFFNPVLNVF